MARPVAVVTGASSGIGAVFARRLAPTHDLVLIARRRDRLEALAGELLAAQESGGSAGLAVAGLAVDVLQADLSTETGLSAAAQRIAAEPRLALLVNNAGFGTRGLFWNADPALSEEMHRLHVMATVRLSHAALRNMVARGSGAIINVSSVAAFVRRRGSAGYAATKSWMNAFTEGLYLELKSIQSPVKVQALCPGFTYSEFHERLQLDRGRVAGPSFWLRAEDVVDASLRALPRGKLFVVPGWRYKAIVSVVSRLPTSLRLAVESARAGKKPARPLKPAPDE